MDGETHPLGLQLARYEVRAKIADGGMAVVYVAAHGGEIVALKMIREEFAKNQEFVTMLLDEARIVSRLVHANIVRTRDYGAEGGQPYIAMELLQGQSLWSVWEACRARGVRLRYDMIAWIGARVAEGLHYAHELRGENGEDSDIVHRDVNATNIFVTYDGEIKIIDFGLAKAANRASKTAAGIIKGKVAYMSPEQAVGAPVDRRTDVFALGTTLWELACDRRLFKTSDEVETLKRVHAAEIPDPTRLVAGFPPALWSILARALARDRERRYATAAEMGRDLDAFAGALGPPLIAEVMRELFPGERERHAAWLADASSPQPPGPSLSALRPRSTLSTTGDVLPSAPCATAGVRGVPRALAPAPVVPAQESSTRRILPVLVAIVVVVAIVVAAVLLVR